MNAAPFGLSASKPCPHDTERPFDRLRANGSSGSGNRGPFDRLRANGNGARLETHGHNATRRLP